MKIAVSTIYAVLAALIAPAALAGTSATPEIDDATGETPRTALDVDDVWFTSLDPRWPDRSDRQLAVNIKVVNLGLAAPIADGTDDETRYYYEVLFTHPSTGASYTARCYIHLVDGKFVLNPVGAGNYGVSHGCDNVRSSTLATLLEVRMNTDPLNGVVQIILSTPYFGGLSLTPGTSVDSISIQTAGGKATSTAGSLTRQDPRGPTADVAGVASFTM